MGGGIGARHELDEKVLCRVGIHLGVEGGTAERFHVDEHGGVGVENGDGIGDKITDVVGFLSGEIPVVADPWERFSAADVEGMTEKWRTGEDGTCGEEEGGQKSRGKVADGRAIEFHEVFSLRMRCAIRWEDAETDGCVNAEQRDSDASMFELEVEVLRAGKMCRTSG